MIDREMLEKLRPGCKVRVREKNGSIFEGVVLARKHGSEPGATVTVRTVIAEVGVEKIYPLHSPLIEKLEIVSLPKRVRRAKLYFLRGISGKKMRQKLGV